MINFKNKDYKEIFKEMILDAYYKELVSNSSDFIAYIENEEDIENMFILFLSVFSKVYDEIYDMMEVVRDGYYLLKAQGGDLDNLGLIMGVNRPQSTRSYAELVFILNNPQSEDKTIPSGVQVSTPDGRFVYRTVQPAFFGAGTTEVTVPSYAVNPGSRYRVGSNRLTRFVESVNEYVGCQVTVYNPQASSGGTSTFTDKQYLEYLLKYRRIHQTGNEWAFKNFFANYEGLDSYRLIPKWDGTGTVKAVLDPGDDYHLNKVYNGLQGKSNLYDDDLTVVPAEKINIPIHVICNVDIDQINPFSSTEKDDIRARIKTAINVFVNGGIKNNGVYHKGLVIGEDFIPHKLMVFVDNEISELKDISVDNPSQYISIGEEQIGSTDSITVDIQ